MDFTTPKARLWGGFNRLFLVRDLASGSELAAVACRGETTKVACAVLLGLFLLLGAPLVLKQDNGGAFRSKQMDSLLAEHVVVPLTSPPYRPQYNGSCERAGGVLKKRAAHVALAAGRRHHWLAEDIEIALVLGNTTARPWGATGPTPAQAFARRVRVRSCERGAFKQTRALAIERALQTFKTKSGRMPTCCEHAAIDRKATQAALCEHGYLEIRRGRLSTLVSAWKRGRMA